MQRGFRIILLFFSGLAVAAGLYMNRFGVDVEPDSAVMMSAGILFAHGEGVSQPNLTGSAKAMTWFPPMVPWMVSICEWSGLDIRKIFAVFNAVSWGVLTGWVGWLAHRAAGRNPVPGILAAAAILTSGAICYVHGMLYSEPPFLLCMTGSLAALAFFCKKPRLRWAAAAALCAGAALLTRYVGLTLVIAGALAVLVPPGRGWRRRLAAAFVFGALSVGPLFAWHLWQKSARHAGSERTLAWHPIALEQIDEGLDTLASFVVPPEFADFPHSTAIILAAASALAAVAVWLWLRRRDGSTVREKLAATPPIVWIGAGFIAVYFSFLLISISIADADTPLDARILSILLPPGAIIAAWLAFAAGWEHGGLPAKSAAACAVAGLLALHGISTFRSQVTRQDVMWSPNHPSHLLNAVRAIPGGAIIFSNEPASVYMATRRKSDGLPNPPPGEPDAAGLHDFNQKMGDLKKTMAAHGGWIVYWIQLHGDPVVSEDIVKNTLPVLETKSFDDGVILHIAPQ